MWGPGNPRPPTRGVQTPQVSVERVAIPVPDAPAPFVSYYNTWPSALRAVDLVAAQNAFSYQFQTYSLAYKSGAEIEEPVADNTYTHNYVDSEYEKDNDGVQLIPLSAKIYNAVREHLDARMVARYRFDEEDEDGGNFAALRLRIGGQLGCSACRHKFAHFHIKSKNYRCEICGSSSLVGFGRAKVTARFVTE